MPIEKEVSIQLKIKRPESQALNQAAESAKKLRREIDGVGQSKALDDAAARAKRFEQQTRAGATAVTNLVREYAKQGQAAREVERVTAALVRQGVAADRARVAAQRLASGLSAGARVAERDVQRLATGLNAVARQQGAGGRSLLGQSLGQTSLRTLGLIGAGRQMLGAASQGATEALGTSVDQQLRDQAMRDSGIAGRFAISTTERIPGLSHISQALTFGARQRTADSNDAVQRAQARRQRLLADLQRREELDSFGRSRSLALATSGLDASSAISGARERIEGLAGSRREFGIGQRVSREIDAFSSGRSGRLDAGGMDQVRAEIGRRSTVGAGALARNAQERSLALGDLRSAQGSGSTTQQEDAARRLVELERQRVDLVRQSSEAEQQRLGRWREWAQSAEEGYRRLAQAERDRANGFREQFALMNRFQQRQTVDFSRRLAQNPTGRGISTEELGRFANNDVFRNQIQGILQQRGDAAGAQEVLRNAGVQGRIAQADRAAQQAQAVRVQLDSRINAEITTNAEETAQTLGSRLLPQLVQHFNVLEQRLRAELDQRLRDNNLNNQPPPT